MAKKRRQFPRTDLKLKAKLVAVRNGAVCFEATLPTRNISVGGVFFESTFFLKLGEELEVRLLLPSQREPVRARGRVVRVETLDEAHAGFALRFEEYLGGSELILAEHFLAPVLRGFVERYIERRGARVSPEEQKRMMGLLAAWELERATVASLSPWGAAG